MNDLKAIIDKIKGNSIFTTPFGVVISVEKNIVCVVGLPSVSFYEVVQFENGARGLVVSIEREFFYVCVLENETIYPNMEVRATGSTLSVQLSEGLIGKVLNGYGELLDDRESVDFDEVRPIEIDYLKFSNIEAVKTQVVTGLASVDWFCPIGYGQKEAVIAPRGVQDDIVIRHTMLSLKNNPKTLLIYCGIGQRIAYATGLYDFVQKNEIHNYIFIVANSSDTLMMRKSAPFVACTVAEYFRDKGYHVVVFLYDLTEHAIACRELALATGSTVAREAYPADITYEHSRILERFANFKVGSMTCIPFARLGIGDDMITGYIVTNVISIADGQLIFSGDKFNRGEQPAIDIGLSVSRIGRDIQHPYIRKLCGTLKEQISQAERLDASRKFGGAADLDSNEQAVLNFYMRLKGFIYQKKPYPLFLQILILHGLVHNMIQIDSDLFVERGLEKHIHQSHILAADEVLIKRLIHMINTGV